MSKYFSESEMACQHCGATKTNEQFMAKLDALREAYGKPLVVSSGYRCVDHPIEAKKSKAGAHTTGVAVDLAVSHSDAHEIMRLAFEMGFKRIGVAQKGSGRFIHLDIATEKDGFPSPTVWSY